MWLTADHVTEKQAALVCRGTVCAGTSPDRVSTAAKRRALPLRGGRLFGQQPDHGEPHRRASRPWRLTWAVIEISVRRRTRDRRTDQEGQTLVLREPQDLVASEYRGDAARPGVNDDKLQGTDLSRDALRGRDQKDFSVRATWQAAKEPKFVFQSNYGSACYCPNGEPSPEADRLFKYDPQQFDQRHVDASRHEPRAARGLGPGTGHRHLAANVPSEPRALQDLAAARSRRCRQQLDAPVARQGAPPSPHVLSEAVRLRVEFPRG
jgi:hypothetical protein